MNRSLAFDRINEINDVTDNTVNVSILEIKNENEKALEELESNFDCDLFNMWLNQYYVMPNPPI